MIEDEIIAFCDALPAAARAQPFGPEAEVWKLGGKIFAILALGEGRVSLKCPDAAFAEMLIETGHAARAPYLPRGGWIALPAADPDLAHRLTESHATIRASLPKRLRDALG